MTVICDTALTQMLGMTRPIMSAPMAGVSGGALAAAVSSAGGFGLIGGGYGDRAWLSRQLDIAQDNRIGVGFITWALAANADLLPMTIERKPKAIFLSFGDIGPYAPLIHRAGVPLIAQVQTVSAAKDAAAKGAQIIVAQGSEAGGHGGARGTMALVPAVVDAVGDIPVIAAGGIADGRGLAAALMLGAQGVLCGTVFYAAHESLAHTRAKDVATKALGDHTVRGSLFDSVRGHDWPEQWQLRSLENELYRNWARDPESVKAQSADFRSRYADAEASGDASIMAVIVGEAIDLVLQIEPASDIVERMAMQAAARLRLFTRA